MADELGRVELFVGVDEQFLATELGKVRTQVEGLDDVELKVTPKLAVSGIKDQLKALNRQLTVQLNDSQVQAAIGRLDTLAKSVAAFQSLPKVAVGVEIVGATTDEITAWRKATNGLAQRITALKDAAKGGGTIKAGVTLTGTKDLDRLTKWAGAAQQVADTAKSLKNSETSIALTVTGTKDAATQLGKIQAQLLEITSGSPYIATVEVQQKGGDVGEMLARESAKAQARPGSLSRQMADIQADTAASSGVDVQANRQRLVAEALDERLGVTQGKAGYLTKDSLQQLITALGGTSSAKATRPELVAELRKLITANPAAVENLRSVQIGQQLQLRDQNGPSRMDMFARQVLMALGMSSDQIRAEIQGMIPRVPPPPDPWNFTSGRGDVPIGPSSTGRLLPPGAPASPLPRRLTPAEQAALRAPELPGASAQAAAAARQQEEAARRAFTAAERQRAFDRAVRPGPTPFDPNRPAAAAREREQQARDAFTRQQQADALRRASVFSFTPPAQTRPASTQIPDSIINGIANTLFPFNAAEVAARWRREGSAGDIPASLWQTAVDRTRTGQPDSFRTELIRRAEQAGTPLFGRTPVVPRPRDNAGAVPFLDPVQSFRGMFPQSPNVVERTAGPGYQYGTRVATNKDGSFRRTPDSRPFGGSLQFETAPTPRARAVANPVVGGEYIDLRIKQFEAQVEDDRRERARVQALNDSRVREAQQFNSDLTRTARRNQAQNFGATADRDTSTGIDARLAKAQQNLDNAKIGSENEAKAISDLVKATNEVTRARLRQTQLISKTTQAEESAQRDVLRAQKGYEPFDVRIRNKDRRNVAARNLREEQELGLANLLFEPFLAPLGLQPLPGRQRGERTGGVLGGLRTGFEARRPTGVEALLGRRFLGNRINTGTLNDAAGNALIGGAFPLLFGQGLGASIGGFAGGGVGGLAGGILGFGGSLVGTAVGAQFDQFITSANEAAQALKDPTNNLQALAQAGVGAGKGLEGLVSTLQSLGRGAEGAAILQQELGRTPTPGLSFAAEQSARRDNATAGGLRRGRNVGGFLAGAGQFLLTRFQEELGNSVLGRVIGAATGTPRDEEVVRQGRAAQERAQQRTARRQQLERRAIEFGGAGLDFAQQDAEARIARLQRKDRIDELQTQRAATPEFNRSRRRELSLQIDDEKRLLQEDQARQAADLQRRRRELDATRFDLQGSAQVQAARTGRFGQFRDLAVAAAEVRVAEQAQLRARSRFEAAPTGSDDRVRLELELERAKQATADATQRQLDLQRQVRLELEAAVVAGQQQVRDAQLGADRARATSNFFRPGQEGSLRAAESEFNIAPLRNARNDAVAALERGFVNQADPAEIERLRANVDSTSLDLEAGLIREADSLAAAFRNLKEQTTGLRRGLEDALTGQAVREGTDAGVNKFIVDPNVVRDREVRAERQLTREVQSELDLLGKKEGRPITVSFTGTRAEQNAQRAEFVSRSREERRADEDLPKMQEQLVAQTESLVKVNDALGKINDELKKATIDLSKATNSLAKKTWVVNVDVGGAKISGDARAMQTATSP